MSTPNDLPYDDEPSDEDLAAIDREADLLAAELALLNAELDILNGEGELSDVEWYRLRELMRDVINERAEFSRDERDGTSEDDAA